MQFNPSEVLARLEQFQQVLEQIVARLNAWEQVIVGLQQQMAHVPIISDQALRANMRIDQMTVPMPPQQEFYPQAPQQQYVQPQYPQQPNGYPQQEANGIAATARALTSQSEYERRLQEQSRPRPPEPQAPVNMNEPREQTLARMRDQFRVP